FQHVDLVAGLNIPPSLEERGLEGLIDFYENVHQQVNAHFRAISKDDPRRYLFAKECRMGHLGLLIHEGERITSTTEIINKLFLSKRDC
ncbi:hypothetical protein MUP65_01065, partial [Patescibacteria group bacterium]|nr:hypothetical protein [Patescibacteria group bacterium]